MPKPPSSDLFDLIKSMSTAEKRHFSSGIKTKSNDVDVAYFRLFKLIDKMEVYDEAKLLLTLSKTKEDEHLPFKKSHLHRLLLESLNRYHRNSGPEAEVLQKLQNLKILYDRGLFWQSEKVIKRIDALCRDYDLKEYKVVLLKWQRIMTLHMQNSKISKKLSADDEDKMIQELVSSEQEILADLQSNLDVWLQVIKVADKLRIGSDLQEEVSKIRKKIQKQLSDDDLTFISRIRLYHSELMLAYLVDKSDESPDNIHELIKLWTDNPRMKLPYFRNYIVSLNIVLSALVDLGEHEECETHLATLLEFTQRNNKEINFINKCKAYSFYYKNYLAKIIKQGNYSEALRSFDIAKTKLYFPHFELFKKSQVFLGLTVANFMEENYKDISRTMVLSHAEEDAVQKGCLLEIRLIYYLSLYKLEKFEQLQELRNSEEDVVLSRFKENPIEKELINLLIDLSDGKSNAKDLVALLGTRDNTNIRYYIDTLTEKLKKDFSLVSD